ncbi:GTPase domain-containing protein [Nannocystis sp. ILAH1]|uniref:GTPase domain-containing protein n=1 Tax=unclassified Nannocystis TaxID=2627009 RepID=UPI00227059D8|nr:MULTISPECIES: GTPase domain-containing protein [unclassified Nannocystis]MCY0993873.1 GTPase domain-containing protein [Nannocystis sp. ILAH1]MCY1065763.1 GTPase domain-containing protein [Nannocystis sp. RBIL2]
MAFVDAAAGEIRLKIVYHGATFAGRTTNLQYIYNRTRPENKTRMVSLATETSRSLECFVLAKSLRSPGGLGVRLHLVCSPGCLHIEGAKEQVLAEVDGVVLVVDSHPYVADANTYALQQLERCIAAQGRRLEDLPLTLQLNKRDLPGARAVAELEAECNPYGRPAFAAVACTGVGVFETIESIALQTLAATGR